MVEWNRAIQLEIERIVEDCECVQKSHGSEYSKEQEKVIAYNEIRQLLGIEVSDEDAT